MLFYLTATTENGGGFESSVEVNNSAIQESVVPYYEVNEAIREGVEKLLDELNKEKQTVMTLEVMRAS